ncbi:DUF6417 family protein [Streptomyces mirabilis]
MPPADGPAEQVRAAPCDHGIKQWRQYLTQEQMESVAYGLRLHPRRNASYSPGPTRTASAPPSSTRRCPVAS